MKEQFYIEAIEEIQNLNNEKIEEFKTILKRFGNNEKFLGDVSTHGLPVAIVLSTDIERISKYLDRYSRVIISPYIKETSILCTWDESFLDK